MSQVQITNPGIIKALSRYRTEQAIAEYIWNGFDAKATCVEVLIDANEIGHISEIKIKDNGNGIHKDLLDKKFLPFLESEKQINPNIRKNTSAIHGEKGVGRLTFFHFASTANWETVYKDENKKYEYNIHINMNDLKNYRPSELSETNKSIGTTVSFTNILGITPNAFNTNIKHFLMREFGWFLELNKAKGFSIKINGSKLDYSKIIDEKDTTIFTYEVNNTKFEINYIQWNEKINDEYSRYYYIDSNDNEKYKETTTLNNKGDHFYHSVFIKSNFFDTFVIDLNVNEQQKSFFEHPEKDKEFNFLKEKLDKFLKEKRKPFIEKYADDIFIPSLEKNNIFPQYNKNSWDILKRDELKDTIKVLYMAEPKIFSGLNTKQKETFIRLLELIIDTGQKDELFDILDEVVQLDVYERKEFAELLEISKLSRIIKTIKLIEDRYEAIDELKKLVFNKKLNANERDHIQKFIEKHYWIFGEQYHLVSADRYFEKALRKHIWILDGEKKDIKIDHPDKKRRMDIFMVRRDLQNNIIKNIVVELKHPKINIGSKELEQVKKYFRVILKQDEFNAASMFWEFYLVGNKFDEYIESELESHKDYGEKSLVFKVKKYKIYVKTWSEIFTEFELRHKFLNDKLELERDNLTNDNDSADEIIQNQDENTATQHPEVVIPKE